MTDFREIERLFRELLAQTSVVLNDSERDEITHFVDHAEYGLALETLVDVLFEEDRTPSDNFVERIVTLANWMSMDPRLLLDRLGQSK